MTWLRDNNTHVNNTDIDEIEKGKVMTRYVSTAWWSEADVNLKSEDNTTSSTHPSKNEAIEHCAKLEKNGFGFAGEVFPIETKVSKLVKGDEK